MAHRATGADLRQRRNSVRSLMEQVAQEVTVLDRPTLLALYPALAEAERELKAGLSKWLQNAPGGAERFTAVQYQNALIQLRSAMESAEKLDPALRTVLGSSSPRAGHMAFGHMQKEVAELSLQFEGVIQHIPLQTAALMAKGDRELIPRFRSSAQRYAGQVGKDIRRQLSTGLIKGETIEQLTTRLQALGGPEGLFRKYRGWAERVVRTEVMNAYNVHASNAIREANKVDPAMERRWDATADRRVCGECAALDGKTAPIDKPFPGVDDPPLHPHCRCVVMAWRKDWDEHSPPTNEEAPEAQPEPAPEALETPVGPPMAIPTTHATFDVQTLANALGEDLDVKIRAGDERALASVKSIRKDPNRTVATAPNKQAQLTIRDQMRKIMESYGFVERDAEIAEEWQHRIGQVAKDHRNMYRVAPASLERKYLAFHTGDGGRIVMSKTQHKGAAGFMEHVASGKMDLVDESHTRGMATLVHETLHSFTPLLDGYYGQGILAEEVSTEVSARKVMRETFKDVWEGRVAGLAKDDPNRAGAIPEMLKLSPPRVEGIMGEVKPYDMQIDGVRKAIVNSTGVDWEKSGEILEDASFRLKMRPAGIKGRENYFGAFLDELEAATKRVGVGTFDRDKLNKESVSLALKSRYFR